MPKPEAFFVAAPPHEEGLTNALRFAVERATQRGTGIGLAVHQKSNLDGIIAGVIGPVVVKKLKDSGTAILKNTRIDLITLRSSPARFSGPVVAAWAEKSLLDQVSKISGATDVIVVPWNADDASLAGWKAAYRATDILTGRSATGPTLDPVVAQGLKTLNDMVNVSTGVSHPSDRALTIEVFRLLRNGGRRVDPESARAWLLAHDWKPVHADAVCDIAIGVSEGRRFRDAREVLRNGTFERWVEAASTDKGSE